MSLGIELELAALLALHVIGTALFGVFEVETPWWRLVLKWTLVTGLTVAAYQLIGHWALLVAAAPALAGGVFHFLWCGRHGIHPLRATPRARYYELRGWQPSA